MSNGLSKFLGVSLFDWPRTNPACPRNQPFRHFSFRIGLTYIRWLLRPGLVESTCRVHRLLSIYEVFVALFNGIGLTRSSAPAHMTGRIGLLQSKFIYRNDREP